MKATKFILFLVASVFVMPLALLSQPKVIAHRGYWNTEGSARNSIASLQKAAEIGAYGSEFDVNVTSDGIAIVNHDASIDGVSIETNPYSVFENMTIANGEKIPTLEQYLTEGMKFGQMKLILEIKSASTPEAEARATQIIMDQVKAMGAQKQVEYIAFSLNVVKEIIKRDATPRVSYLNGDLSPQELKEIGAYGLDYNTKVMAKNRDWFDRARSLGLHINVWTVDKDEDMKFVIENGADYITTDRPEVLQKMIAGK